MTSISKNNKEISLIDLLVFIWRNKITVTITTFIIAVSSIIYVLVVDEKYQVSSLINPVEPNEDVLINSSNMFAGISLGSQLETPVVKLIHLSLKSRDFLLLFYESYKDKIEIIQEIEEKVDSKIDLTESEKKLEKFDAFIKILREKIIGFSIDPSNNTIRISVVLKDKYLAFDLLSDILTSLKRFIREKNIESLNEDIEFYKQVMAEETDLNIINSVKKSLVAKIEKSSTISSNLYSIIEKPYVPSKRIFPKRTIFVIISTFIGFVVGIIIIFGFPFVLEVLSRLKRDE